VRRHRGRRRLTVHPRDDDPAPAEHDRGEGFRAADGGNFSGPRVRQDRVVFLDRRRKNNQLDAFSVFRPMRRREAKSELREPLGFGSRSRLRPGGQRQCRYEHCRHEESVFCHCSRRTVNLLRT